MMIGGGELIETVSAPALADVRRRIFARPHYLADTPIAVEPELWHQAQHEMRNIQQRRGWPLLCSDKADLPNFLFVGVPVVMIDG